MLVKVFWQLVSAATEIDALATTAVPRHTPNQRALAPEQIREYARQIGLDMKKFDADIQSDEVKAAVQEDIQLGQRVGVRGTPTIFVNGKVLQNRTLEGFKQLIDPILLDAAGGQKAPNASKGS